MKKSKKPNRTKTIKTLAEQFSHELDNSLPVTVLPNGDIAYKSYIVKQTADGSWGLYNTGATELIDQFFLKTCALMAAKAYNNTSLDKYVEIKSLDNRYWANFSDNQVYKKNIKSAKEFERFMILLNKLEDSDTKVKYYKEEISRMFKWSFA
jgi:hypothetical protein